MIKFSKQREAIKLNLISRKDHPTADMIYDSIRKVYPNISLGTVYRNLTFLVNNGEAIKLSLGDSSEHFDGNMQAHNHFYCKSCKQIFDLEMEDISFINTLAGKSFAGVIDGNTTFFFGTCEKCIKNL